MATRYVLSNGNWSNAANWDGGALPGVDDDCHSNNFTVTIDQDITVASLRGTASGPAAAGGVFRVSGPYNITANCYAGPGSALISEPPLGVTVNVTGNCYGSDLGSWAGGVSHSGPGVLNVIGNCYGGSQSFCGGVIQGGSGTLNLTGNCYGGSAHYSGGALTTGGGVLNVTGNAYGGPVWPGIHGFGVAEINLYGEAVGHPTSGAQGASFRVDGTYFVQVARSNNYPNGGHTAPAHGVTFESMSFAGMIDAMVYGSGGFPPVQGRHFVRSSGSNYVTMRESNMGPTLNLGELNADYPAQSNVRAGVAFDFGNKAGTCAVPPAGSVAFGVPVDGGTGTAALSPVSLLGEDLITRLGQCATVQTVGDQLAALGT